MLCCPCPGGERSPFERSITGSRQDTRRCSENTSLILLFSALDLAARLQSPVPLCRLRQMAQEAAQFLLDEAARLGFAPAAAGFPIEQGYAPAGADDRPQGQVLIERTT